MRQKLGGTLTGPSGSGFSEVLVSWQSALCSVGVMSHIGQGGLIPGGRLLCHEKRPQRSQQAWLPKSA
jgi:hypothetical protein